MKTLPQDLYLRCRSLLLQCEELQSHAELQAVFVTHELAPYKEGVPEADTSASRVEKLIAFLLGQALYQGCMVLVLFLTALRDRRKHGHGGRQELEILIELIQAAFQKQLQAETPDEDLYLHFANRATEKRQIWEYFAADTYVQVYGPGGLGKSYLLEEVQREAHAREWQTIWLDFATDHSDCRADKYKFLQAFARQINFELDIVNLTLERALRLVHREAANVAHLVLLLDNADCADMRLLAWIRAEFLETLALGRALPIHVLGSGQQVIAEWRGLRPGRPFREILLSRFDDPHVIGQIINTVVDQFGPVQTRLRRVTDPEAWQYDLRTMSNGLLRASRGHPLAIHRLLAYAVEQGGLLQPTFFTANRDELYERCLGPIVGERVLPTVDSSVREVFRSLCVFRFIWPTLIQTLSDPRTGSELATAWEPFLSRRKTWMQWWSLLQDTHLIQNTVTGFLLSPVIRQITNQVLQAEDGHLYRSRHQHARSEHQRLVYTAEIPSLRRVISLLEVLYHATQDGSLVKADAEAVCSDMFHSFLRHEVTTATFIETGEQLLLLLRKDAELAECFADLGQFTLYNGLIELVQTAINDWKGPARG